MESMRGKSVQGILDAFQAALEGKKVLVCTATGNVRMELEPNSMTCRYYLGELDAKQRRPE